MHNDQIVIRHKEELSKLSMILNKQSISVFKIDKILFRDPLVSVKNFSVVNGVYDIKIEVNSEKDFLNYLSNLLFSNKFILSESPSEILPEKSYEIKVIPIPFS